MARSGSDCDFRAASTSAEVNPGRRRSVQFSNCLSNGVFVLGMSNGSEEKGLRGRKSLPPA